MARKPQPCRLAMSCVYVFDLDVARSFRSVRRHHQTVFRHIHQYRQFNRHQPIHCLPAWSWREKPYQMLQTWETVQRYDVALLSMHGVWSSMTVHPCLSMTVHETQKCNHGGLMKQVHDSCHGLNDHVMSRWVYMHCQPSQLRVHDECHPNDVHIDIVWPRRDCFMQHGQTHSSECM